MSSGDAGVYAHGAVCGVMQKLLGNGGGGGIEYGGGGGVVA